MTLEDLEALAKMNFENIDKSEIVDINDIFINQSLSKEERILDYIKKVKNPYFVKIGDAFVKMSFSDNGLKIDECIERYLYQCIDDRL